MKPIAYITVLLALSIVFVTMYISLRNSDHIDPVGEKTTNFPDKEVCSLACGVGWETYCTFSGTFNELGWKAKVNDEINWVIDKEASGNFRFDGLSLDGSGITGITMKLNDRVLKGKLEKGTFRTNIDEYVKARDVISVIITSINGDGFVKGIQPNGVH